MIVFMKDWVCCGPCGGDGAEVVLATHAFASLSVMNRAILLRSVRSVET
jgi:hypothetical protein